MKRLGMWVAAGALILGSALPALAQPPPGPTVSFGGEMRVFGFVFDNMRDFTDTTPGAAPDANCGRCKDSDSFYFMRWRLRTTVESADKKARAVWHVEVGDIVFGNGGGASGNEFGTAGSGQTAPGASTTSASARVGNGSGGGLGNDGINVETKNAYLQFEVPFLPIATLTAGLQGVGFLSMPAGDFFSDDAAAIRLDLKFDPVDIQFYAAKLNENSLANPDDNDMYTVRAGLNLTKDIRFTVEGMVIDEHCFARKNVTGAPGVAAGPVVGGPAITTAPATTATGGCVKADLGDSFWIGATASVGVAGMKLSGMAVYGERALFSATNQANIKEKGFGFMGTAQVPVGPLAVWGHGWWMRGDENRIVGGGDGLCGACNPSSTKNIAVGQDWAVNSNTTRLNKNSDKLPLPAANDSYNSAPYVGEWLTGLGIWGGPTGMNANAIGADETGTWGVGGSVLFSLLPNFTVGGGVAYVEPETGTATFGDRIIEVDAGAAYKVNANQSIDLLAGYLFPDKGDDAWGVGVRTRFAF